MLKYSALARYLPKRGAIFEKIRLSKKYDFRDPQEANGIKHVDQMASGMDIKPPTYDPPRFASGFRLQTLHVP